MHVQAVPRRFRAPPRRPNLAEALEEFEKTASPRIKFYINNLETIDERRSAWEADIASKHPDETVKRKERKPADDDSLDVPEEQDEYDIDSDGDEEDADETDANCLRFDPSNSSSSKHLTNTYEAGLLARVLDFTTADAVRAPSNRESGMPDADSDFLRPGSWFTQRDSDTVQAWSKEIVQQRADFLAGAKPDRGTDQPLEEVKEPPEPELVDTEDSTLAGVAKRFKLNRKQRKAFFLIGETFEREHECAGDPEKPRPPPLRIYIGGPGRHWQDPDRQRRSRAVPAAWQGGLASHSSSHGHGSKGHQWQHLLQPARHQPSRWRASAIG